MEAQRQNKLRGLLGMAKKAGRLTCGTELVCDGVREGKITLVLLAADASENTRHRARNCAAYYQAVCLTLPFDRETLSRTVGASSLVAAAGLADPGFSRAIRAILEEDAAL